MTVQMHALRHAVLSAAPPAAPAAPAGPSTASAVSAAFSAQFSSFGQQVSSAGVALGLEEPKPGEQPPSLPKRIMDVGGALLGALGLPLQLMNTGFATLTSGIAALFPALPAATLGSLYLGVPHGHLHPPSFTPPATPAPLPLPSMGPIAVGCSTKVMIGGMPAARAGDLGMALTCCGFMPLFEVKTGSSKVFIGGTRAARILDFCDACTPTNNGAVRSMATAMAVANMAVGMASVVEAVLQSQAESAKAASQGESDPNAAAAAAAMAAAQGVAAASAAAALAADALALALSLSKGTDIAVPPGLAGAVTVGMPNVLIGGFPMINFPDPVQWLFKKIGAKLKKKKKSDADDDDENSSSTGRGNCGK
jgi:uncharacterized Zn-binding protein involved in type VI secretion